MKQHDENIDKELKSFAGDGHPFEVPGHYFEGLPMAIQKRTWKEKPGFSWLFKWPQAVYWSLPSLVVLLVASYMAFFSPANTDTQEVGQMIATVSDTAIIDYLAYEGITEYEIYYSTSPNQWGDDMEDTILPESPDIEHEDIEAIYYEYYGKEEYL